MRQSIFTNTMLLGTAMAIVVAVPAFAQEPATEPEVAEEARQLETVVVRGEFIPAPQRQTSQVATFLLSEDLQRQGDANAALALQRLSGLSVVGNRFIYIRGLGDRYSSALLNGSPLPSPEPLRRTVPLDLFPSDILDSAEVQKTFSPNYPGEFGGGVINLRTLKRPSENFLNIKTGVSYNTETTGQTGIFVRGSDTDWTGYDDGLRDIPAPLAAVLNSNQRLNEFSDAEIETAGESLVNSPLSVIQQDDLDPGFSGSISGGYTIEGNAFDIGLIGTVGYDNGWETQNITRQLVSDGVLGSDFKILETTYNAQLNGLGSATLNFAADHEVQGTVFYVHDTSKEAQITEGFDFDAQGSTGQLFDESSGWFERQLVFGQLRGEHFFNDLTVNWRGSLAQATRDAPYERALERLINDDGVPAYLRSDRYVISFSELTDDTYGLGGDVGYEFDISPTRQATVMAGVDVSSLERDYKTNVFSFAGGNSLPEDVQVARPDFLFSPDNIDPARFVLRERFSNTDNYQGTLDVLSGFVMAEFDITDYIQATVGVRYEEAEQQVITLDRFGNLGSNPVELNNDYVLPSAIVTWNFADDLQLRLGYSETIARPQFRELASSQYNDPDSDRTYRGFYGLKDTELTNYDARLEYYFGRNQFVTLAGFYKELTNPIEEIQFESGTFNFITTFFNSPKAELFGGEFEYRTRFAFPIQNGFFQDRDGIFSINYTYTSSEVQAKEGDIVLDPLAPQPTPRDASLFGIDGTALQGTPENIINMQLGWDADFEQLTLLVGWVDERVLQRGIAQQGAALPDIVEDPGVQVDLVYRRDLSLGGRTVTLGLSGRNLLDEKQEEFQISEGELGRTEFNTYDRGQSFSASLTTKF